MAGERRLYPQPPPPSDGVAIFVRSLPLGFCCAMLTNGLTRRSSSSYLRSGGTPRAYGSFPSNHSTTSNGSNDGPPPPYTHSFTAPGPTPARPPGPNPTQPSVHIPRPTGIIFQKRTRMVISRGLTVCLAIILFQSVLIICRSDVLARYIDLDAAAHRASREKSERERIWFRYSIHDN